MPFSVEAPGVEELAEGDPHALVSENALRKARAVDAERVLGADTAVVVDGEAIGKPAGEQQAEAFLRRLSGRNHEVMTGVALIEGGAERCEVAVTRVRFHGLSDEVVAWYLASGEWRERAGGYAIQGRGAALVAHIDGDYTNVVGLPVSLLMALCRDFVTAATGVPRAGGGLQGR